MVREHDLVTLTYDLPEQGLKQGDINTVPHYSTATRRSIRSPFTEGQ
jgi:hypothetical protein